MIIPPCSNKQEMYRAYEGGFLGNKLRSWPTVDEFLDDPTQIYPVGLRYAGVGGGAQYPDYSKNKYDCLEVEMLTMKWCQLGAKAELITVNETSDDSKLTIQGEIIESNEFGYALVYSTVKMRMREALKLHPRYHNGPGALLILKEAMTPSSYADFEALLELYPGHAIEFSCFSQCLGAIPGRNTLIWEVRKY